MSLPRCEHPSKRCYNRASGIWRVRVRVGSLITTEIRRLCASCGMTCPAPFADTKLIKSYSGPPAKPVWDGKYDKLGEAALTVYRAKHQKPSTVALPAQSYFSPGGRPTIRQLGERKRDDA